ncbi:MAG: hypothetical protein KDN05_04685 [Verrucomicrobiae bacterium]|nr:hypothetical protein [Verrucomicrobiae bacterium]
MNNQSTNQRLARIKQTTAGFPCRTSEIGPETKSSPLESYRLARLNEREAANLGVLGRMAFGKQSLKAGLEAARIVQRHELDRLEIESDALKTEIISYYRAKSANTAEMMNTFLQQHLMGEELTRMDNLNNSLSRAAEIFNRSLEELEEKPFPEEIKETVARQLYKTYETACDRIQQDVLMHKYVAGAKAI